jgi:hypothetical protein
LGRNPRHDGAAGWGNDMGLTKTETAILANAARRESLSLLPLPRFIYVRGLSIIIALERLIRHGLVAERQAVGDEPVWRNGRIPMTLGLTGAGLAALNQAGPDADRPGQTLPDAPPGTPYAQIRPTAEMISEDTRHRVLMAIISRPQGADVKQIQQETGLPLHSVRAVISGLRAEGYLFDHVRDGLGATSYQLIGWLPGDGGLENVRQDGQRFHA